MYECVICVLRARCVMFGIVVFSSYVSGCLSVVCVESVYDSVCVCVCVFVWHL